MPTFSLDATYSFYSTSFSKQNSAGCKSLPSWVTEIMIIDNQESFNTTAFKSADIKRSIKHCNKGSSPGDDEIHTTTSGICW